MCAERLFVYIYIYTQLPLSLSLFLLRLIFLRIIFRTVTLLRMYIPTSVAQGSRLDAPDTEILRYYSAI